MASAQALIKMYRNSGLTIRPQFKSGRYTKSFQRFNKKAVERGDATWYFDPAMRVEGRRIVPVRWNVSAEVVPTIQYRGSTREVVGDPVVINIEATGLREDAERSLQQEIERTLERLHEDSPTQEVLSHVVRNTSITKQRVKKTPAANGGELNIDGFEDGRHFMPEGELYGCGYHAIAHRYGNVSGWKKKATKHYIFNLLRATSYKSWEEVQANAPLDHQTKLEYYALSPNDLVRWGKDTNTSVYVIDENTQLYDNGLFKADNPRKPKPLAMLLKNGHFYLLEKEETLRSLGGRFSVNNYKRPTTKTEEAEPEYTDVFIPADTASNELASIVRATGILPVQQKIKVKGDLTLQSWIIGSTRYIVQGEGHRQARRIAELNNWKHQPEESLQSWLADLVREKLGNALKSKPPKATTMLLNQNKDYNHLGATPHYQHQVNLLRCDGATLPEDTIGYDINSQDYYSMKHPTEAWAVMDFNSVPTEVPKDQLPFGFYFIDTDDEKLAMGRGLYCRAFTLKMLAEQRCLRTDLKFYIPCVEGSMKEMMDLLWFIDEYTKKDKKIQKIARNTTAGLLGKSLTKRAKGYVVEIENIQEAMNYLCDQDTNPNSKPFIRRSEYYEDTEHKQEHDLYLYGSACHYTRSQHYLPMYLQILQWGAMRLYDHLKPFWKYVMYRKRDAFFIQPHKGFIEPPTSTQLGAIKREAPPRMLLGKQPRKQYDIPQIHKRWTTYTHLDSSNASEILEIIKTHGGAEIDARAGYGKTHVTRELIKIAKKELGWNVACAAFTNKAANNLGGVTIHKLFGMDITDTEPKPQVALNLSKIYDLIVFDEKSMIPAPLWCLITQLETRILVVGDWRQLPPVEKNTRRKYQHHPSIYDICRGQRIQLNRSEHCRYDTQLEQVSNNVMTYKPTKSVVLPDVNIAWSNACVVRINKMVLETKTGARYPMPPTPEKWNTYKDGADKHWVGVKWDIVVGQPLVIASATSGIEASKNEMVRVQAVDNDTIYLEDNIGKVARSDFWKVLRPAYCITTHKAQGDTFTEEFGIWEWDRMDEELRYTALTRAKSLGQIHFH